MHPTLSTPSRAPAYVRTAIVAVLATVLALLWAVPAGAALPGDAPGPGPAPTLALGPARAGRLGTTFLEAATEFGVPAPLLEAIGYVESHWDGRGGVANDFAQYGVMGLHAPPGGDTLPRAAALLGLPAAQVAQDDQANIRAAAALLQRLAAGRAGATGDLSAWYPVVAAYSDFPNPIVARSYAFSVFGILRAGVAATRPDGETLVLAGNPKLATPDAVDPLAGLPNTDDYPAAHWLPAAPGNFQYGRPYGPLNFIVIHDTEGSYQAAMSWFQNPSAQVSAHFVFRSSDGDVTQMVHNADTAYHTGNWDYNVRAIGVEHEGYMSQPGWYTQGMYQASAALVRTMADRFNIPKDHAHIIGHYQIPNQSPPAHVDPGPNWNWASYLALVRNDAAQVARVRNSDSGYAASPGLIDPAHGWTVYPGQGWNGGDAIRALSTTGGATNLGTWSTSLPAAGLYDIYAYIPWVDNGRHETQSARYTVTTAGGAAGITVNQKALTDAGILQGSNAPEGEWAHLGRFNLSTWSTVTLDNAAGDSADNVWFDTLMWIPAGNVPVPTAVPTSPPTRTPTRTPTWTPTRTPLPWPSDTPLPAPTASWTPGPCGMRFVDLPDTDWAYPYVAYLYCRGITSGYGDGTFRGWATANRGQLAKMVTLGQGWPILTPVVPSFGDVPPESPYFPFVETAFAHGVISGYGDGTFRPFNSITRAQLSKMIVVAKGWAPLEPNPPSFADVPSTYWAFGFIEAVHARNIVGGYGDGTFRPGSEATRAQLSKMLSATFQLPDGATVTPGPTGVAEGTATPGPSVTVGPSGTPAPPTDTPIATDTPTPTPEPSATPTTTPSS